MHHCTYLRQYHCIRPYIVVSKIPNFNPQKLPYWNIYKKEGKDKTIVAGGTYGGKFIAGLSGGQRKLLLFEMVYQRCRDQSQLLIVFDEPFAGVTGGYEKRIGTVARLLLMVRFLTVACWFALLLLSR